MRTGIAGRNDGKTRADTAGISGALYTEPVGREDLSTAILNGDTLSLEIS